MYHLFVWTNLNFLHISQWITLPTQSCLLLYSFWTDLLHSLIMWLIVSFQSPHNLHLVFCCVLSILALIWLVHVALFCVAIRRDSISLLKFPFLNHVHIFSCEMLLISRLKPPQSCFSSHFRFLVISFLEILMLSVLFLRAVISFSPHFVIITIIPCESFYTSIGWWSFNRDWVTSLRKSPELFWLFWPSLTMPLSKLSRFFHWFPIFPIFSIFYSSRVFHITSNWWFFIEVWVSANLLRSPGLFSVF